MKFSGFGRPRPNRGMIKAEEMPDHQKQFLAEKRNFKIEHSEKKIYLSTIFKWYENDFLKWFKKRFPERDATVLNYIALFLSREKAAELIMTARKPWFEIEDV